MRTTLSRIGRALFAGGIAASLGIGLTAATSSSAPKAPEGRHCDTFTHSQQACRSFCALTTANGFAWDPATGCCNCLP